MCECCQPIDTKTVVVDGKLQLVRVFSCSIDELRRRHVVTADEAGTKPDLDMYDTVAAHAGAAYDRRIAGEWRFR